MSDQHIKHTGQLVDQVVDLKRMLGQFGRLIEISLTLNSTLDPNTLLQFIIKNGTDILECEAVSVLLYDEKENQLLFSASTDSNPDELENIPVPLESSIAGMIFTSKRPELINDAQADPRIYKPMGDTAALSSTRNLIGVPMAIGQRTIGVLEGINKKVGGFYKEDLDLLTVIASQAAVAINNARMMQSLQKAYDELSTMDKLKSDFMANASHELRTPLNIILGYAEFLKEDAEGASAGHANKVLDGALQLRTLIEDMTNMNLLESGTQELQLQPVAIQQIVHNAYKEVLKDAHAKSHEILRDYDHEPIMVKVDPEKMKRVFLNVLGNAIRFTPSNGKITISIKQDEDRALVSIADNGIGIPASDIDNIFEDFYQVEDHRTRTYGGMGLGLSIAQGITRLHGGDVRAESPGPDQGATFYISLPIA